MSKRNNRSIDLNQVLPHWGVLFLEMMSNIRKGSVTIVTPEEKFLKYTGIEEGEDVCIRINKWRFCEDIFMKGDIGLGESYISGYWDCGNINNLIKLRRNIFN